MITMTLARYTWSAAPSDEHEPDAPQFDNPVCCHGCFIGPGAQIVAAKQPHVELRQKND